MKKSQILGFFIIYVDLTILKILSKSEIWSPEPVRFAMEHTIYTETRFVMLFLKQESAIIILLLNN